MTPKILCSSVSIKQDDYDEQWALSGVFFPFRISDDFPGGGYVHQDGRGNPRHKCGDESVGRATAGVEAKEGRADGVVP